MINTFIVKTMFFSSGVCVFSDVNKMRIPRTRSYRDAPCQNFSAVCGKISLITAPETDGESELVAPSGSMRIQVSS